MARKNLLRVVALTAAIAIALSVVFGGKLMAAFEPDSHAGNGAGQQANGGRKVLFWYDAMNPQHHYDKPGKAPDGMDLVPMYADEQNAAANSNQAAAPAVTASATSSGRKILYWYDPMHPWYKADKPGKAPDCGMDLVPKYADEQNANGQPGVAAANANAASGGRKVLFWYDAMNPQHHYDKPGKAPDGMDLVPKYADQQPAQVTAGSVTISPEKQQLIGVQTAEVKREVLERDIHTTGQIATDESKIAHIHVKVNGFIDKVYVDYIGQFVKKGQPVFTLYSPDLVATEQEYLIAKRGDEAMGKSQFSDVAQGADSLLHSTRERLKLWDISDDQIKQLDETGKVSRTLTFYSPITGFVTDRKAFPNTSVNPDTELYTVADLSTVWVNADVYEYEAGYVKVGQRAKMQLSYYPGKTWNGRVSYVYPTVDPVARTIKVRLQFGNPDFQLKPQMFADVQLKINYGNHVVVPQGAVLDSGTVQRVFVARGNGVFEPRRITVGPEMDGKVVVLSGLEPGETVVTSGNFLIDSESQLSSAMGAMEH